jgi:hypothetical protein
MSFDPPEPPDVGHRHGRGPIPTWLEWLTSLSALVVSICSIFIAVHNSHDADKALAAQTYPYLDLDRSDATPSGQKVLSIGFVNNGVGPAHEQSFRLKAHGQYVTSLDTLLAGAVGRDNVKAAHLALVPLVNHVPTRFIPANTNRFVFQTTRTATNAKWWDLLDKDSDGWVMEVCYCSVFNECWTRREDTPPRKVAACHRDEATEFNG